MVEIFKTVSIDYRQGPEKGVGFQCFPELFSAYEATMVKNEQCIENLLDASKKLLLHFAFLSE